MENSDNNNDNNNDNNASEVDDRQELSAIGSVKWTKLFRVFKIKIPLWLITILALVIAGYVGFTKITTDDAVTLRPAITDAKTVKIEIVTCDQQIDKHNLDIRKEELSLINKLEDIENVGDASVRIDRDEKLCSKK